MHKLLSEEYSYLNKNVIKQDKQPGNTYNIIEIYQDLDWFKIPNDEDAFQLPKPTAGLIKNINVPCEALIKRTIIGYAAINRIHTYTDFKKLLNPIMIQLINGLCEIKQYGPDVKDMTGRYYLSFNIIGSKNQYFKYSQEHAGVELRAVSDCVLTNILK